MTNFLYNTGIPAANNNPSTDQPDMQTNTDSTNAILNVDHFTFNNNNGGMHQQVQIVSQNTIPSAVNNTPVGLKNGAGTIYTKPLGGPSDLFFTPDQSGDEYKLTNIDAVNFATFGTFTNYLAPADQKGGWTFLPGGLIMQYGTRTFLATGNTIAVTFPKSFTNIFNIQTTIFQNAGVTFIQGIKTQSLSGFNFTVNTTGTVSFYWIAIGN